MSNPGDMPNYAAADALMAIFGFKRVEEDMSTRATIRFSDPGGEFFVYRHCDGFPENVEPDIKSVIEKKHTSYNRISDSCLLATWFVILANDPDRRLPDYEITCGFHGDESYRYFVCWNDKTLTWDIRHE